MQSSAFAALGKYSPRYSGCVYPEMVAWHYGEARRAACARSSSLASPYGRSRDDPEKLATTFVHAKIQDYTDEKK